MNEQKKFVVPPNKTGPKNSLVCLPIALVLLALLLVFFNNIQSFFGRTFIGDFVTFLHLSLVMEFLAKGCLYLGIGFLLFGFMSNFMAVINKGPVAVIDSKGIWVFEYGFMSWDNIEKVVRYAAPMTGGELEFVAIQLKDVSPLHKQATLSGKFELLMAKIFGYYPVMITNAAVSNDDIMYFIQLYKDAHDRSQCRSDALAHQDIIS
jgi:hypothetical protein